MSRLDSIACWKCGGALDTLPVPFSRAAECPQCHTDVHVCRQCEFYDTSVARSCREPVAEDVQDKTRANFCGYFTPGARAHRPADPGAPLKSRRVLDALFGDHADQDGSATPDPEDARQRLDALFESDQKKR